MMKTKLLTTVCIVTLTLAGTRSARATTDEPLAIAADVLLLRPACLVATVAGSAIFVVALPFTLLSKSVKPAAQTLVVKPAQATFTRPVGDVEDLQDF